MTSVQVDRAAAMAYRPTASMAADARLSMLNASPLLAPSWLDTFVDLPESSREATVRSLVSTVKTADLWHLSPDMVEVMEAAAPAMPAQQLLPEDPPTLAGIAVLGRPSQTTTPRWQDLVVYTNALLWMPIERSWDGRHALCIMSLSYVGPRFGWFVSGQESWGLGDTQHDARSASGAMDRARIATMWTLAQQKRMGGDTVSTNRAALRRTTRAGLPPEAASVRLLDVRRPSGGAAGEGGSVDYSHRWMVSGHWRNQWLPSRKAHRAQWIAPYVKGPEDKPLVIRTDVRTIR